LRAELALLPQPRTMMVVMMELEKNEAELKAASVADKSGGRNVCLRTITKPVTEFQYCSQMLWNVIGETCL
jgi:hypothetical protein